MAGQSKQTFKLCIKQQKRSCKLHQIRLDLSVTNMNTSLFIVAASKYNKTTSVWNIVAASLSRASEHQPETSKFKNKPGAVAFPLFVVGIAAFHLIVLDRLKRRVFKQGPRTVKEAKADEAIPPSWSSLLPPHMTGTHTPSVLRVLGFGLQWKALHQSPPGRTEGQNEQQCNTTEKKESQKGAASSRGERRLKTVFVIHKEDGLKCTSV